MTIKIREDLQRYINDSPKRVANWSKRTREAFVDALVRVRPEDEASIRKEYEDAYQEQLKRDSLEWLKDQNA